jgi:small subunit ribosomal protein S16
MKKFGRKHRPFFRIVAVDIRRPRDGRVIEELGFYDPLVPEKDARASLKSDRIDYWLGVGAQPSDKVAVLIKKYGTNGTNLEEQKAALERLAARRRRPDVPVVAETPAAKAPAAKKTSDKTSDAEAPVAEKSDAEAPAAEKSEAEASDADKAADKASDVDATADEAAADNASDAE